MLFCHSKLINEFSLEISAWDEGLGALWCMFACLYMSNGVGNQAFAIFKSTAYQATKMHERRLLLISVKNNTISVVLLVQFAVPRAV